jgi:hypothetical protein
LEICSFAAMKHADNLQVCRGRACTSHSWWWPEIAIPRRTKHADNLEVYYGRAGIGHILNESLLYMQWCVYLHVFASVCIYLDVSLWFRV